MSTPIDYTQPADVNLTSTIDQLCADSKTLQKRIQVVAVWVLMHLEKHHNPSLVNRLIVGLSEGTRRVTLQDWFCKYGALRINERDKCLSYDKKSSTDIQGAMEKVWWNFGKESLFKGFDHLSLIKAINNRASKQGSEKELLEHSMVEQDRKDAAKISVDFDITRMIDAYTVGGYKAVHELTAKKDVLEEELPNLSKELSKAMDEQDSQRVAEAA